MAKKPEDYLIGDILRAAERELAPVSCLAQGAKECSLKSSCKTIAFWEGLNNVINEYMDSKTLEDLM